MSDTYTVHVLTTKRDGVTCWLNRAGEWSTDPGAAKEYLNRSDARNERTTLMTNAILFDKGRRFDGLPDLQINVVSREKKLTDEPADIL